MKTKNMVEKRNKRNRIIIIVSTVIIMFTQNHFTIYLNAPATVFENNMNVVSVAERRITTHIQKDDSAASQ